MHLLPSLRNKIESKLQFIPPRTHLQCSCLQITSTLHLALNSYANFYIFDNPEMLEVKADEKIETNEIR